MSRELRVTWTLAISTALALFGDATMYAVLPSQYGLVGITAVSVGWMLSVNRLVRPPLNFVSGWLTEHVGRKAPYVMGVTIGVLSTAGYGLVRGFWPLLLLRALWGLAWALLVVSAYAMILDISTVATRGRLSGIYASFSFFGGAFGPLLGGFLVDACGFRTAMLALAACTAIGALLAVTIPPTRRKRRGEGGPHLWRSMSTLASRCRVLWRTVRTMDRRLLVVAMLNFAHRFFFAGVFYGTFGRYLLATVGDEWRFGTLVLGVAGLTGALMFARNVITVAVGPLLGYLSDRLQDRPTVLLVGEAAGVAGLAAFALGRGGAWSIALGVTLAAMAYGIVPPLLVAWMGDVAGDGRKGPLVGAYQTMGDIGSGIAPAVAYPLLEIIGVHALYAASAACLAVSIPLIVRFRARGRAAQATRGSVPGDCAPGSV